MKIALVHDRIINFWWAEKVFKDLLNLTRKKYPKAEIQIFTTFFDKNNYIYFPDIKINYIFQVKNNKVNNFLNYRNLMPFFPLLQKKLSKKIAKFHPNKTIISSFAIAKNINLNIHSEKILYLHSPMQYIWEMRDEYINKFSWIKKQIYKLVSKYLQKRDLKYKNIYQSSTIIYNSQYTASVANRLYWWKNWTIARPKIEDIFISKSINTNYLDYFVFVGRVVKFAKELDKIIKLFNNINENLLIIGDWPDKEELMKKAKWNIIFLDKIEDPIKLANIIGKSRWLINLTKESFWLATAEALSLGIPIFGYAYGWTAELIWIDKSAFKQSIIHTPFGIVVTRKDYNTLLKGFEIFKNTLFDREKIKNSFIKKYKSFDFENQIIKLL